VAPTAKKTPSAGTILVHLVADAVVACCDTRIAPIQWANGTDSVVYI
jgi:hypothetical protein